MGADCVGVEAAHLLRWKSKGGGKRLRGAIFPGGHKLGRTPEFVADLWTLKKKSPHAAAYTICILSLSVFPFPSPSFLLSFPPFLSSFPPFLLFFFSLSSLLFLSFPPLTTWNNCPFLDPFGNPVWNPLTRPFWRKGGKKNGTILSTRQLTYISLILSPDSINWLQWQYDKNNFELLSFCDKTRNRHSKNEWITGNFF